MTAATFAGHIVEFNFINDFDSILTVGAADLHSEKDPDEVTAQLWHRLRDDSIPRAGSAILLPEHVALWRAELDLLLQPSTSSLQLP